MNQGEVNEIIKKLLSDPQFYAVFKEPLMANLASFKPLIGSTAEAIREALTSKD